MLRLWRRKVDTYVDATGHTPATAVVENNVDPDCENNGSYDNVVYCTVCGVETSRETEIVPALGHDEVAHEAKAPTCTEIGWEAYVTCSRCDYTTYVEKAKLGHDYKAEVTAPTCTDKGYTTHTCTRCNDTYTDSEVAANGHTEVIDAAVSATCTTAGKTEGKHCSVCNEVLVAQTVVDALGHDEVAHEAKAPTCEEIGWDAYVTCSRCSYTTYVEKAALGHDEVAHEAKAPTCTAIGWDAYVTCSRCDYTTYVEKAKLGHDEVVHEAKAPTCTEIGWEAYVTCSRCDYTTYVEKAKLGHDEVAHDAQAPTCTAIGWDAYVTCSRCDYTTYVEKAKLGHDEVAHEAKAPTCTEIGWEAYETCSRCDYTTYVEKAALGHDEVSHDAQAPTCTAIGWDAYVTCSRCDYTTYVEKAKLGHDEVSHEAKAPTCEAIGWDAYVTCSRCDYTTYVEKAKLGHDEVSHEAQAPTCTEIGWEAYVTCSRCDYTTYVEKAKLGHDEVAHDAKAPTCTAIGWDAYETCSRCDYTTYEEKAKLGHDEVAHESKAPTCTEIGWDAYVTCSRCDYTTYVEKAALGHDEVAHDAQAPTCTEIGWEAYVTCSRCDYTTYVEKEALGHDEVSHEAKAPTCEEIGWEAYVTCSRCDYTTYEEKAALGHDEIAHAAKAPTCEEIGWEAYVTCSRCDYTTYVEKAKLGHDEVAHAAKAPTCTEIGWDAYVTCSRCDYTTKVEKEANGHSWVAATCTAPKTCSVCGATEGEANGHTAEALPGKDATCEEKGLTEGSKCSVCGEVLVDQEEIAAKGHAWSDWTQTKAPECEVEGTQERECSVCGETEAEAIDALVHSYTYVNTNINYHTYTCQLCGATGTEPHNLDNGCEGCEIPAPGWFLVKDASELKADDQIVIVASESNYALGSTQNSNNRSAGAVVKSGDSVTFGNDVQIIILTEGKSAGTFGFYVEGEKTGYLYAASTSSNYLKTGTLAANGSWTITINEKGVATVKVLSQNARNWLRYNPNTGNNNPLFSCYTSGQQDVSIYKYSAGFECTHETKTQVAYVAPTCENAGSKTLKCSYCEEEIIEEIPALGHNLVDVEGKAATCLEAGYTAYKDCSRCDYIEGKETILVLSHEDTDNDHICNNGCNVKITECTGGEATCTEQPTCEICGNKYGEALGHDLTQHEAKAPTCTAIGWDAYEDCSRCDYTTYVEKAALGHTTENGTCERCGEEQSNHEHNKDIVETTPATCTQDGKTVYKCSVCERVMETVVLTATGHSYLEIITAPTCTAQGYTTYTCACGDNYEGDYVDALGHTWQEATCTAPKTCSVCSETEGEALGHNTEGVIWSSDADYHWKDCKVCGADQEVAAHDQNDTAHNDTHHWKECSVCGKTIGEQLAHSVVDGKCECGVLFATSNVELTSIPDAIDLSGTTKNKYTTEKYYIIGEITKVDNTTYGNIYIKDADGNTFYTYGLYSVNGTRYDSMTTKPDVGDVIVIYGVLGYYDAPQMKNATLWELKGQPEVTAQKLADNLVIANTNPTSDFTLPTVDYGTITWTSSNTSVISIVDGKATVTRPEEDTTVTLTAEVAFAGETAEKTFELTVAKVEDSGGDQPEQETGWIETEIANIKATDKVVITWTTSNGTTYALPNDGGTATPEAIVVTVEGNKLYNEPADTLLWNIANDNGNLTIYVNGSTEEWLYCTNSNSGVRVGTNADNKAFTIDSASGYLKNTATSRYVGVYTANPDVRCYTNTTGNTANQTLKFYVLVEDGAGGDTPDCTHEWDDATCTTPRTCSKCSATEGDALGHTEVVDEAVTPTCTEAGKTAGSHCSVCNEVIVAQETVEATGHTYVDGTCSKCGAEDPNAGGGEVVPATISMDVFANKGNKVGSAISWSSDSLTVTNTQANGSTTIRTSDTDHYRVYSGSLLAISVNSGSITKIVITCSSTTYAGAMKTSAEQAGYAASANGSVVTITLDPGVSEIEFKATAQTRIKAVEVTYIPA